MSTQFTRCGEFAHQRPYQQSSLRTRHAERACEDRHVQQPEHPAPNAFVPSPIQLGAHAENRSYERPRRQRGADSYATGRRAVIILTRSVTTNRLSTVSSLVLRICISVWRSKLAPDRKSTRLNSSHVSESR